MFLKACSNMDGSIWAGPRYGETRSEFQCCPELSNVTELNQSRREKPDGDVRRGARSPPHTSVRCLRNSD